MKNTNILFSNDNNDNNKNVSRITKLINILNNENVNNINDNIDNVDDNIDNVKSINENIDKKDIKNGDLNINEQNSEDLNDNDYINDVSVFTNLDKAITNHKNKPYDFRNLEMDHRIFAMFAVDFGSFKQSNFTKANFIATAFITIRKIKPESKKLLY